MLTLGEFGLDNYTKAYDPNNGLDWSFFLAATFFGQLLILNMLIALMADTFDKVFENKTQFILQLKLEVLNDYSFLFATRKFSDFLYIIKLKNAEAETGQEWQGRIKAMTRSIQSSFERFKEEILSRIRGEVDRDAEATKVRQQELSDQIGSTRNQMEKVREELKKN